MFGDRVDAGRLAAAEPGAAVVPGSHPPVRGARHPRHRRQGRPRLARHSHGRTTPFPPLTGVMAPACQARADHDVCLDLATREWRQPTTAWQEPQSATRAAKVQKYSQRPDQSSWLGTWPYQRTLGSRAVCGRKRQQQAQPWGMAELDCPGFLGGCDLWEGWGSWYPGSRIPLSCGNGQCKWSSNCVRRQGMRVGRLRGSVIGSASTPRHSATGLIRRRSTPGSGPARRPRIRSGSLSWNARSVSCAGRMRF
jgi:hypothetical protein